jgi:predicted small secreted protein
MKKDIILLVAVLAASIILISCSNSNTTEKGFSADFAKGVKVSSSGLSTVNNGLELTDSYLASDGRRMENNEVLLGKKIAVVFEGVKGFKEKNGKVFPGLNIVVMDEADNVLLRFEDILKSNVGYDAKDASVLSGTLIVGDPLKQGQNYKMALTIWDKEGDGGIAGSVTLKVK